MLNLGGSPALPDYSCAHYTRTRFYNILSCFYSYISYERETPPVVPHDIVCQCPALGRLNHLYACVTVVAVAHREWGEIRTAPIPTQRAGSGFLLDSSPSPQNGLGAGMGSAFSVVWLLRLGSHAEGVENE